MIPHFIKEIFKKNKVLRFLKGEYLYYRFKKLYEKDPQKAADVSYHMVFHKHMDLKNPKNLIEKIAWLQLHSDTSLWTVCADKYRMREYVERCGYHNYLPKLYGHWDNPDDIDFNQLPDKFVLKANNGCGTVLVVNDKSTLVESEVKKTLKKWLKRPYGYIDAQSHYLRIQPCVIAEELLGRDKEQQLISPKSLIDYKIWCFNGRPECILLVYNRDRDYVYLKLYDVEWNPMPQHLVVSDHYRYNENDLISKPVCLDEMLSMASGLSKPFKEVRVDFYVVDNRPVIGELTFTTGYGYFTEDYYRCLGDKFQVL